MKFSLVLKEKEQAEDTKTPAECLQIMFKSGLGLTI